VAASARLWALLARDAPRAVVIRRGPSKQVALVAWDTGTDRFETGQWFRGRIYERRCDLSPSGERLVYFAANWKAPWQSWTAVSRPPWLTALALWPNGTAWGGGGLFETESRLALNHGGTPPLAEGFALPAGVSIVPFGPWPGVGEDAPLLGARRARDGWRVVQRGKNRRPEFGAAITFELDPPEILGRAQSRGGGLELREITYGMNERGGPWYVVDYQVVGPTGGVRWLRRADWADWDRNGDLLYAVGGKIFRLRLSAADAEWPTREPRLLVDLGEEKFVRREAPPHARRW
jgi:hypothetical protein